MVDLRNSGLVVVLLGLASGCASVANSQGAVPLDARGQPVGGKTTPAGLRVTGEELSDLASPHFEVLEVTFENPSERWIRLRDVKLDFESPANNAIVRFPIGSELHSLMQATQQRNAIAGMNKRSALALVALGGAVAAGAATEPRAEAAAGLLSVGAVGALAATDVNDHVQKLERAPNVPELHLYSGPIQVPPGLFAKRWVAIEAQDRAGGPCLQTVLIDYALETGGRERVSLKFRDPEPGRRPPFQPKACYEPRTGSSY
jgi:hypothetical protein